MSISHIPNFVLLPAIALININKFTTSIIFIKNKSAVVTIITMPVIKSINIININPDVIIVTTIK